MKREGWNSALGKLESDKLSLDMLQNMSMVTFDAFVIVCKNLLQRTESIAHTFSSSIHFIYLSLLQLGVLDKLNKPTPSSVYTAAATVCL